MPKIKEQITPLVKLFALLTKQYLSILGTKLSDLPIDRYFYAFWVISNNDGKIDRQDELYSRLQVWNDDSKSIEIIIIGGIT